MTKEEMEQLTLEEALARVDEALNELGKDIPLEQSFALYKEGMELLGYCDGKIKSVEEQVLKMNKEGDFDEFQ